MLTAHQRAVQNDQLGFFFFLALALHAILILGLGFAGEGDTYSAPQLTVTLAQYRQQQAPEDAQFIAQANQMGSGRQNQPPEIARREVAEFSGNRIRETSATAVLTPAEPHLDQALTTTATASEKIYKETKSRKPEPLAAVGKNPRLRQLSDSIASLEARLDQQQQEFAQRPKIHRLNSRPAKQSVDAAYLHRWRTQVEAIGNRHYPVVSSRYGIYGDLRLLVAIRYDGSIEEIAILASSGHAVLDEAAIRIVHMAAPFAAFPAELRSKADRLEIIRTWKFRQNRLSSVQD